MVYIPDPKDFKEVKYQVDSSYENYIVVEPPSVPDDWPFDPYGQLVHAMRRDWRDHCPEGKQPCALIVDTFSEATEDIQRFVATAGRGNAGVGEIYGMDIEDPWSFESMRTSQMNDYGKSQDLAIMALKMGMKAKQYPHVIFLGHRKEITETKMERQPNGKYQSVNRVVGYDMGIPGRKWLGNMTKFTDQYVWHTNEGVSTVDIRLHLRSDGKHQTKFRSTQQVPGELEVPFSHEGQANVIREVAKLTGVDMASTEHGLRLVAYGMGGTGKTMLWTSLPEETFEIGPAIYMPFDPSAVRLASVWQHLRASKTKA